MVLRIIRFFSRALRQIVVSEPSESQDITIEELDKSPVREIAPQHIPEVEVSVYPPDWIRGLSTDSCITPEGALSIEAFGFDPSRPDGWRELSIHWCDDDSVVAFTMQQSKDGRPQFRGGLAIFALEVIHEINRRKHWNNTAILSYERSPLPDNPYHGNILIRSEIHKQTYNTLRGALALKFTEVLRRATYEAEHLGSAP